MVRRSLPLVVSLLALGCGESTSILLEVTSPMAIPSEIDSLQVAVTGDSGGNVVDRRYDLGSDWPHTVSIRPGAMESGGVTITVTAQLGGSFVARRVVRSAFVAGTQVHLLVEIPRECAGVMCGPGRDCVNGMCADVEPEDGGMPDAGPRDGGGGCALAADCNDDVNCTVDTCVDSVCTHEPDDGFCAIGEACHPMDGCPPRVCGSDGECSDGVLCNGAEICVGMACMPGTPID